MDLTGKRVLVTGGAGFVGSHLVEALLARDCGVRVLAHYNSVGSWGHLEDLPKEDQDRLDIVLGDISDPYCVDGVVAECDVVFHLAALIAIPYSYRAPMSYVQTNVVGTVHVLEACRRHSVERLVHTSTSETYGTALYTPIDEKHPMQGQSPYSASKIGADKMAEAYYRSFDVPVVTLRPFNTYGPRQSARAVIPTIITQALVSDVVRLGSLDPVRDLTFVDDTAQGFIAAAQADGAVGKVVSIGAGQGITIGDLAQRILAVMNRAERCRLETSQDRMRPGKSEVFELLCDNRLARDLLGWVPTVSLNDGLRRTVEYLERNLAKFKPARYTV